MSIQASEAFGLFLTALRNAGASIPVSDKAAAIMVATALDEFTQFAVPRDVEVSADTIAVELRGMVEARLLPVDNGSDY